MEKNKDKNKKIKTGIIAGVTSASVLLGATFDSPQDLLENNKIKQYPMIEQIDAQNYDELLEQIDPKTEKFKNLVYQIPLKIRMVLGIPMWILGNGIIFIFELLLKAILTPIGKIILGFILQTLILIGIIALCVKVLLPHLPWSKIFTKRTLILIILGSIIMSLLDYFMPLVWDKYNFYRFISKIIIGIFVIGIIMKPFITKKLNNLYTYEIQY